MTTKKAEGAADHEATLARYGLTDLPEVFSMQSENGVIQERHPCYECMAEGFYGRGDYVTFYGEGAIIVLDDVPNDFLRPLNRAAGLRHAAWRDTLPNNRAPIDIGDMSEAARMLAKDPRVTDLSPEEYQQAVVKLSEELKLKRLGKDAYSLPSIQHNFNPASGGKAPPIMGARHSELTQRPGSSAPVRTAPGQTPGVRLAQPQAAPALASQTR